jgi:hypothetical protein
MSVTTVPQVHTEFATKKEVEDLCQEIKAMTQCIELWSSLKRLVSTGEPCSKVAGNPTNLLARFSDRKFFSVYLLALADALRADGPYRGVAPELRHEAERRLGRDS